MDAIDDFTMIAVDIDGEDGIEGLVDLFDEDVGEPEAILNQNEVVVLDDNWANWDGGGGPDTRQPEEAGDNYNNEVEFTNIPEGGAWRDIEVWAAEGGGGDGGYVYFGKADEFVWEESRIQNTKR